MTQEKIVSEVKSKLGQTQVTDETIIAFIAINPLAEDVEPTADYFEKIVNACKSTQGLVNSVAAQSVKDAKEKWEKNLPKPPTPPTPPVEPPKPDESEAIKEMREQLAAMQAKLDGADSAKNVATLRSGVLNKADELKVSNKALWNDVIAAMEVKEGANPDDLLTAAKSAYEAKLSSYFGTGATPYGKTEGGVELDQKTELDNYFAKKKAEGRMGLEN